MRQHWLVALVVLALFAPAFAQEKSTLDRDSELARRGEGIARNDAIAWQLRNQQPDDLARRGFDIGMAVAVTDTLPGPGKQAIQDALDPGARAGYASAVAHSLERNLKAEQPRFAAEAAGATPATGNFNDKKTNRIACAMRPPAPFIGSVQVDPGWTLEISFTSTQRTPPLVTVSKATPIVGPRDPYWNFPDNSGTHPRLVNSSAGRYYVDYDLLKENFSPGIRYFYIITVFDDDPAGCGRQQETGSFIMARAASPGFVCSVVPDHLLLGKDGNRTDCFPYKCQAAQCMQKCNSVSDCVAPTLCDRNERCIYHSPNG